MRSLLRRRVPAFIITLATALAFSVQAAPAQAADYPSWGDLQNAKANTAAAANAVTKVTELIAQLDANVARTMEESAKRLDEYLAAQDLYDDATMRVNDITNQSKAAEKQAGDAANSVAQIAAQLYRTGGNDVPLQLFFSNDAENAEGLLNLLGDLDKLSSRTAEIYKAAEEKRNIAQSLGEQAIVAQAEREKLRLAAENALAAATAAQQAAEDALAESEKQKGVLQAQLAFLQDAEAKTTASYEEGERIRIAEEARKAEEARRAREAAERAARDAAGDAGQPVVSSGWSLPASGRITDPYGPRSVYCGGGYCTSPFHYADDIGTGCGAPIYAASSGTVSYAAWSGSYGNYVKIDHGGGISTAYAHIRSGGTLVSRGQWVNSGDQIAWSGTTGASTGCHLHFEVWENGSRIDPLSFMAARGVYLG